jgi:hypothetical protein
MQPFVWITSDTVKYRLELPVASRKDRLPRFHFDKNVSVRQVDSKSGISRAN